MTELIDVRDLDDASFELEVLDDPALNSDAAVIERLVRERNMHPSRVFE